MPASAAGAQRTPRKLHIGGTVKAEGWEVLNAIPAPCVDHVCNANDLSRFAAGSFDAIYASHVVEHLDYKDELKDALVGWNRVLVPGGRLYVSVPDLDALAGLLLDKDGLTVDERFHAMRMLFGGHVDRFDYHVVGLNEEFLGYFLTVSGYVNIQRVKGFGLFEDASSLVFKGLPISLNMLAEKPRTVHAP
jgi:predicted SAM-dependent methyltransferase